MRFDLEHLLVSEKEESTFALHSLMMMMMMMMMMKESIRSSLCLLCLLQS